MCVGRFVFGLVLCLVIVIVVVMYTWAIDNLVIANLYIFIVHFPYSLHIKLFY